MKKICAFATVVVVNLAWFHDQVAAQTAKAPPQAEWDKATADIAGTDAGARDLAVGKVKGWIAGGWVSSDV